MTTDHTDAYLEGYLAGYETGLEAWCPYPNESLEHDEWTMGWLSGNEDFEVQDFWRNHLTA